MTSNPGMFANGQFYERFMGRWSRRLAPAFLDFAGIPDGSRVIDVGCGTGALAETIAARIRGSSAVGIDPSTEYIAYASSYSDSPELTFEVGDAQRLRFEAGCFDAAASLLVFNFIPEPALALRELCRVVRPGGIVGAAVWDYGGAMQMLRSFWDAASSMDPAAASLDEKHMPLCRAGELHALWETEGLGDLREEGIEVEAPFESFDDFWSPFLLSQGPAGAYIKGLSDEQLASLRSELQSRLPEGSFSLRARAWAVRGTVPTGS